MGSMGGRAHFRRPFPLRTSPILSSARLRRGASNKQDNRSNGIRDDDDDQRSFAPTSFNTLERRSGGTGSPILPPFKVSLNEIILLFYLYNYLKFPCFPYQDYKIIILSHPTHFLLLRALGVQQPAVLPEDHLKLV